MELDGPITTEDTPRYEIIPEHGDDLGASVNAERFQGQGEHKASPGIPEDGMLFASEDEAYRFYKNYAKDKGFTVRKGKTVKAPKTKQLKRRQFVCSREGQKNLRSGKKTKLEKKSTRSNCNAKLVIVALKDGQWKTTKAILEHNHDLDQCQTRVRNKSEAFPTDDTGEARMEEDTARVDEVITPDAMDFENSTYASNHRTEDKQLGKEFDQKPGFKCHLEECFFSSTSRLDFEQQLKFLLETYKLEEHPWFNTESTLYKSWEKWSDSSCEDTFTAGIQSMLDGRKIACKKFCRAQNDESPEVQKRDRGTCGDVVHP
ncbi:hypothetical protein TIFTF001_022339 [Ficus carica]|uniref:FAR1 domain-containing protein n=1 Tax=Ficus carica TaxID=3494 RepID=A0AA88AIG6_FICCA|nr:hypothetical protein TIFTF001_022339 [Ficus carica]